MSALRPLLLALTAASCTVLSPLAAALSLGEVQVQSHLSQPLRAEIALGDLGDLNADEVRVGLASSEEYAKAGLDRPVWLSQLRFETQIRQGRGLIRLSSAQPVREPYLGLLLEVVWPKGRQLREFTLLLDPPGHALQALPAAPVVAARTEPAVVPAAAASVALQPGGLYRTQANDRLWDIARAIRGERASPQQAMLAIQRLNPQAFDGGSLHRLRRYQDLRLPNEAQMLQISAAEAMAALAEPLPARQLDARRQTQAGAAPAQAKGGDSLSLVGSAGRQKGSDKAEQTVGQAGEQQAQLAQVALAQEDLNQARREGEELRSRIQDLESQLAKLQRLVALKDAQLAQLQAQLASVGKVEQLALGQGKAEAAQAN